MIYLWNGAEAAVGTAAVPRNPASGVPWCPCRLRSEAEEEMGALNTHEERKREIEVAQAAISRLSTANLRISRSPDLETGLREALEGARGLTGAHYGASRGSGREAEVWPVLVPVEFVDESDLWILVFD